MKKAFIILSSIIALFSCGKSEPEAGFLSVNPTSLAFDSDASTKTIEVSANCSWNASIEYSGDQKNWLTLSTLKAQRGCTAGVKVTENGTTSQREAVVTFKTDGGLQARLTITQKGMTGTVFIARMGSYNLRVSSGDVSDPDNNWSVRKTRLWQSIRDNNFDVFGVQEVTNEMQTAINNEFAGVYECYFFSPYAQNGVGNKAQGILYKTSLFSLVESHYFWLSDTPDKQGLNDICSDASYSRGGCCCVLKHKDTGIKFLFMCAHGHLNDNTNALYAHVIVDREKMYNSSEMPSFFVGDLNCRQNDPASATYRSHYKDTYLSLDASARQGGENTYNGYKYPDGKPDCRIDFIYFKGDATPTLYTCNKTLYNALYASDHFPIWAQFKIVKK